MGDAIAAAQAGDVRVLFQHTLARTPKERAGVCDLLL